ncbi:MAG TPA: acyl-CoA dehydrogenase family protein [Methylomirabilota bacterium]|jgi:glutaryl-CoA dehydrogenase|nr:acyl-CoA dehydrogenase family protein [Methylomirabilota bacterium]
MSQVDYYQIEELFSEEERMVRDVARRFVDEEFLPRVKQCFREGSFPTELIPRLGQLGFLGITLPTQYGCAGLSSVCYGLVSQELERGDSGLRSFASVQSSLVMYPIYTFGSEAQKSFWLPRLARAEAIGCFGLTEPDFGSNPGGIITRARREKGGFVLNGTKRWITNGSISDVAVVWAKLEENGKDTIRGFLVEKERKGFTRLDIEGKFSMRASITSELIFEDCWIPAENLLPGSGGLKSPLMCLTQARYGISWGAIGAAIACYESALDYAKNRVMFSRPIGGYQLVQSKLVWMITEITKAQLLALRLGRLKDAGKMRPEQVSMAKMNNVSIALQTARLARDILGGNGIIDEYPIIRHMLNLETVNTYEGTEDIHRLTIGRDITGLNAFE